MAKNVLLLVTGMTPQIITETVYGLAIQPETDERWVPDEVHVISTQDGLNQIRDRLFAKGNFQRLIDDYQLPNILFDESCLHVITDSQNQPLTDLKTPHDNERAANAICEKVRELTVNEKDSLYVSIAGGRKTMGFYAGYALSLYGRDRDRMSHVLVDDKFEKSADFYYPTPDSHFVTDRDGKSWDAKSAEIWLADIPFVRLRGSLPKSSLIANAGFSEVVASINIVNQPIHVQLNCKKRTITIGHKTVKLSPREFAFYRWFAELALVQAESVTAIVEGEHRAIPRLFELWKGEGCIDPTDSKSGTFDKPFFEQRLAKIKSLFIETFTENVAKLILIKLKNGRGSGYILPLQPEQIEIIEN